jgi:copper chaperone NosL
VINRVIILFSMALLLAACADGPRDIEVGAEECAHCRMIVSEERFAAQLRTEQGRSYVFDSIECMAEFIQDAAATDETTIRGTWVTDFDRPGTWLPAGEAAYLRSPQLRSPMGLNLSAYARPEDARIQQVELGGEVLTWSQVGEVVAGVRVAGGGSHAR